MKKNGYKDHNFVLRIGVYSLALLMSLAAPASGAGFQDDPLGDYFTHTATSGTISFNYTIIDHPILNGNPDAIVMATQNWNPDGSEGTYNNHNIGVWYNGANWAVFNQDEVGMPENAAFNIVVPGSGAIAFVHKATAENSGLDWTLIDHPLLNGNPDARVMITQNWNPGGSGGVYNDHEVGAWYDGANWAIINEDRASMTENASFNVLINGEAATTIVHTATPNNIFSGWTVIDHPLTNDNPDAFVTVTQNWNPDGGEDGVYNEHPIGVWYNGANWAVFNQDQEDMPENAAFNVSVLNTKPQSVEHVAATGNIIENYTVIDHPSTNGDPDAIVIVTQNWNPGGLGNTYNNRNIGVWFDGVNWAIFNQDITSVPENAAFNVLIPGSASAAFVHKAEDANTGGNYTTLDHPSLNGNPDAIVKVTQNWNPGGGEGVYNDHAIGVWYTGSRWSIYNQDQEDLPLGASFNVLVLDASEETFVHTATTDNTSSNWTVIDHPLTNDNPRALLTVTQNWNPGGTGGIYNDHEVGVWYNGSKWTVFNQDQETMTDGASFNVLVYGECVCSGGVVSNEDENGTPETFRLGQNYPNPFNPSTTISYEVAAFTEVRLTVFNLIGQELRTLVDGPQAAGIYEVAFDASGLPSGSYMYRLSAGDHTETRVMVLMK